MTEADTAITPLDGTTEVAEVCVIVDALQSATEGVPCVWNMLTVCRPQA